MPRVSRWFLPLLLLAAVSSPLLAQGPPDEELRKQVEALRAEVARLQAQGAAADRVAELERRIDLLAAEVEKARTGGATEAAPPTGTLGLAPAASKVYGITRGVSIGGYGEAAYENVAATRQDGEPTGEANRLDALRSIVYVGYKFSDRILFNSEIEIEHATTGEGAEERGEVSLEFGYLDFRPRKALGMRAGLVLVPMGFLNELHEPPIFHGVRRPAVETRVIPSTWREAGFGAFGDAGHFAWRAYVVSGLASTGFEASGIREGRQQGSASLANDLTLTGRVDFSGLDGLVVGGSFFTGRSGQGAVVDGKTLGGRVSLFDLHAQYERRGLQVRALLARSRVADAALVNAQNGLAGPESVGERQYGYYVQAAYDVMTLRPAASGW